MHVSLQGRKDRTIRDKLLGLRVVFDLSAVESKKFLERLIKHQDNISTVGNAVRNPRAVCAALGKAVQ